MVPRPLGAPRRTTCVDTDDTPWHDQRYWRLTAEGTPVTRAAASLRTASWPAIAAHLALAASGLLNFAPPMFETAVAVTEGADLQPGDRRRSAARGAMSLGQFQRSIEPPADRVGLRRASRARERAGAPGVRAGPTRPRLTSVFTGSRTSARGPAASANPQFFRAARPSFATIADLAGVTRRPHQIFVPFRRQVP